jgi:hypothetical protein
MLESEQTTTRLGEQVALPGCTGHFTLAGVNLGVVVALTMYCLAQAATAAPAAADSKTFSGVTPAIFECVKATSKKEHNTDYISADGKKGQAVTNVFMIGTVILDFDLDPGASTITYTIKSKPGMVGASKIWDGTQETIDRCK